MKGFIKKRIRVLFSVVLMFTMVASLLFVGGQKTYASSLTLLNTYGEVLGHVGNCVSLSQLQDSTTLAHIKSQYNSITLENQMKPDALLGSSATLLSVSQAKNLGYYIPSSYSESYVPKINFDTIDKVLQICYENGISVRAHTLIWHSQTPSWFFKSNYTAGNSYVSETEMNRRMELYIKTVMNHVYTSEYGSCVYAWDVVNEYLHASNSDWEEVYGDCGTTPEFVKRAFQYAHDCISYFGLTDSVSLFYNDYNTYMEVNDVITMINYINSDTTLCNGVGMQSHLGTSYPSVAYYTAAMQSFVDAGLEVQVTELDVTNSSDSEQASYLYSLMSNILKIKAAGGNITGLTFWGLSDEVSWISGGKNPLLFSTISSPKTSYYQVLQAYSDSSFASTDTTLSNGWYYIKNVNAQKYLQVEDNEGGDSVNVEIGTGTGVKGQKWYLENQGDGYITLKNGQGYMLDVQYGEDEDGTNIQTYSANGADAQKFKLVAASGTNIYGILTKASSDTSALDVYNFGTSDGSNVCEWTYYANSCQLWVFESCSN